MLSPRDLLRVPVEGDDDLGDTYATDQPGMPDDLDTRSGYTSGKDHRTLRGVLPFNDAGGAAAGQLAANGQNIYRVPYKADGWIVTIPFVAGVNVELSQGVGAEAVPIGRFGPGGYARIPSTSDAITLSSIAAVACFPVVVTISGFGVLNADDILIVPGMAAQPK